MLGLAGRCAAPVERQRLDNLRVLTHGSKDVQVLAVLVRTREVEGKGRGQLIGVDVAVAEAH